MPLTQEIFNYIAKERQRGVADDAIRAALLAKGWNARDVADAFSYPPGAGQDLRATVTELQERLKALEAQLSKTTPSVGSVPLQQAATPAFASKELLPPPPPPPYVPTPKKEIQWEAMLGGNWLAKVGVAALLLGTAFFLKLAFDNNWVGETGRIIIGILGGLVLLGLGEFWKKRYSVYAQVITGGGLGILYLSLFGGSVYYHKIPVELAFLCMAFVTAAAGLLAIRYESALVAVVGVLGGFVTPMLMWREFNNEYVLLVYTAILDLGVLALASFRNWRPLTLLGLVGSLLLFGFWSSQIDVQQKLWLAEGALTVFWLIFVGATTLFHILWRRAPDRADLALMSLNAGSYFGLSYILLRVDWAQYLGLFTIALAAFYAVFAFAAFSATRERAMLTLFLGGISLVLLTIAAPLQLDANWITVAWAVEGATLVWLGFLLASYQMRMFGLGVLVIAAVRLVAFDFAVDLTSFTPVLNPRFFTYAVGIAAVYASAYCYSIGKKLLRPEEQRVAPVLSLAANFLTLWILSAELISFFDSRALAAQPQPQMGGFLENSSNRDYSQTISSLRNAKNFSLSALWAVYGIGMMIAGIFQRSRTIRIAALGLIWFTILKVFLFDALGISGAYRVAAFMTLGVILLATAFLYQRFRERIKEFFLEEETPSPVS